MSSSTADNSAFAEVFAQIRSHSADYLTEKSLHQLKAYWTGYTERDLTGSARRIFCPPGFHEFVSAQYKNDTTHGAISIITLYEPCLETAWNRYFELLDDFSPSTTWMVSESTEQQLDSESLRELIPAILARPALYVGNSSFHLIAAFLEGWLRSTFEMQYPESDYERKLRSLFRYIEEFDINLPGPSWSSIIWYWTGSDEKAIELFSNYIHEYIGQQKGWIQRIEYHMERRLSRRGRK